MLGLPPGLQLTIIHTGNGQFDVKGPLQDPLLCKLLLLIGGELVQQVQQGKLEAENKPTVIAAPANALPPAPRLKI